MDVLQVVQAARKHWGLILIGVIIGVLLSFVSTFHWVQGNEGPGRMQLRSRALYTARMQLLIAEPHWDIGRYGTPMPDGFNKTVYMAPTYAWLLTSDQVVKISEGEVGRIRERVSAKAEKDSPIIWLNVTGYSAERSVQVAQSLAASFSQYLKQQQDVRNVPENERIAIQVVAAPKTPKPQRSGAMQLAALTLVSPTILFLGLAVTIENGRRRRTTSEDRRTMTDTI
jgi:capsular polysaccharide biosynthesis protein